MNAPLRWLLVAMLLTCLALASAVVVRVNQESGAWAMLVLLCAMPMALASLRHARVTELLLTAIVLLGLGGLHAFTKVTARWQVTVFIEHATGPITLSDRTNYVEPSREAERIPFASINDAWRILHADNTPCVASWTNGSDAYHVRAPLANFFQARSMHSIGDRPLTMLALFLLSAALLFGWWRVFLKHLPHRTELLWSGSSMALTFLLGVLIASAISPPHTWLSNEFLSRPDDWLCYETGARAMLGGNWALIPPPGSVEVWSLLYTPVVAALHALLGPSTRPIYIVQFAAMLLLIPLFLRLIGDAQRRLSIITAIAVLLLVVADINLHYAWHLLSDLLPLLLIVLLFITLKEKWDVRAIALVCGLLYLARLEMIGVGPLVFLFLWGKERSTPRQRLHFVGVWLLCIAPYFIRWALLYGDVRPFPVAMEGTGHVPLDVMLTSEHMVLKLRALFGDYSAINPELRFRYHWLIIHVLFVGALGIAVVRRHADHLAWLALVLFGYVLLTRVLSPSVGIYGHRHSLALVLLEGLFVVLVSASFAPKAIFAPPPRDRVTGRNKQQHGPDQTSQVHSSRT
jgi:hypothetical protein